jgi:hypothetical protein
MIAESAVELVSLLAPVLVVLGVAAVVELAWNPAAPSLGEINKSRKNIGVYIYHRVFISRSPFLANMRQHVCL